MKYFIVAAFEQFLDYVWGHKLNPNEVHQCDTTQEALKDVATCLQNGVPSNKLKIIDLSTTG